ncbi:hypothetical protein LOD99_1839 [Oopsacas minuta]|uniref:Uncharacterized protein n=1 Tax=Oopsacas minuta TaxID=111878 RepID=A0AAV7K5H3_9METZ|nr:hypothetical protein LOD99_1839 [Oopsacas minuta]
MLTWFRKYGLLANVMRCTCRELIPEGPYPRHMSYIWRRTVACCKKTCSIRHGSFFEASNILFPIMFKFLYYWSEDLQAHMFLEKQLDWSPNTVVDWKNFMRDV